MCCGPPACRWPGQGVAHRCARSTRRHASASASACARAAQRIKQHTRLPGYAHGKLGTVEAVHGPHVFADAHAQGLGDAPQWLYRVAFDGRELWGDDAAPA